MGMKFQDLPKNFFQSLSQKEAVLALGLLLQNPSLQAYLLISGSVICLEVYLVYVLLGKERREKLIGLAKKFSSFLLGSSSKGLEQPILIDSLRLDPPVSVDNFNIDSSIFENSLKTNTNTNEIIIKKTKKATEDEISTGSNNINEPETYEEKVNLF